MKKNYSTFVTLIVLTVLGTISTFAQQVPNPGFEDWSGEKYDGQIQPTSWFASNVTQVGFNFNFAHREAGHSGSYSMMVQDQEVGAMGITEPAPGYFSLGHPWTYLPSISEIKKATAGTYGGINWKYRPDTMSVWIKRIGDNTDKEDFHLLYYAWSGTAKSSQYKGKNGNCTSISQTNEESDIRLALNANDCGTDQKANQIAEGWWRERKTYGEWTNIRVPIYYFNNDVPTMMNIIFSASNYPNFRDNSGLYPGNSLYVDDVELIYSSKIQKLYLDGKEWKGFDPNSSEEQTYSLGRSATAIPTIKAVRGVGSITNAKGNTVSFAGRELTGSEISITNGVIDGAATVITVKSEDGKSTTTYKVKFVREASKNAKLANIFVNSQAINNFQPSVYNYTVELPYGTTTTPVVSAEAQEEEQVVSITQPNSTTGSATIQVTAADKTTKATYSLQFKVAQLADNTLKDIKVNGESLAGFTPSQTTYRVSLPTTTTTMPTIEAISAYPAGEQTITHTKPSVIDGGVYQISVTTPGNPTPKIYKLNFKLEASSYSLLKNLQMGDNWIKDFDPNVLTYYVNLPLGTSTLPKITYEKGESTQTVKVQEGGLNGVTKVTVTAGNGINTTEYKIVVTTEKSEISTLNMIYVGGSPLADFAPNKTSYSYTLPIGTTTLPEITVDKADEYQTVSILSNGINGTTRITVTAQNGSSTIYQIAFGVKQATDATLKMIYLDGEPLADFNPNKLEYNCPLPKGTTQLPVITYDQSDEYQTITVRSGGINGDYKITVRPQTGASQTYVLHFSVATSDNALLDMIYLDGQPIADFDPNTFNYVDSLPLGVTTTPTVTYKKSEESQKVLNVCIDNIQTIKVTAESGRTVTYTITFIIQRSESAYLKMIYLNGDSLEGFDAKVFDYTISLQDSICPAITVDKEDGQQITITTPYSTGQAKIMVKPESSAANTYTINFVNVETNDALLKQIYIDGNPLAGFDPKKFTYAIECEGNAPSITYDADSTQTVTIFRNEDTYTIYVVAGEDKVQYQITVSVATKTDCTLRDILLNETSLTAFSSNTYEYNISLAAFEEIPSISYQKQYSEQVVFAGLKDANTYTLLVTAQSGDTARYTLRFQREILDDANLVDLQVDGMSITFHPTNYDYHLNVPEGYELPSLNAIGQKGQDIVLHNVSDTAQQVIVTAQSGRTNIYTVTYTRSKSSNALLSDILINGKSIRDFQSDVFAYTDTLPWRTKVVPCVQPVGMHPDQVITTYHSTVNGITKIHVLSPDSTATADYTIHFPVVKSSNLALDHIMLDHDIVFINYHPDSTDYTISMPYGDTVAPLVLYAALEPEQMIQYISRPLGQTSQIIVTAENGNQRTYNLHFKAELSREKNLLADLVIRETGEILNVRDTNHTVVLPYGMRMMNVDYTKRFPEQTVWVQPGGVKNPTIITVKSNRPNEEDMVYTIVPQVETQDPAVLTDINVDGITIEGFDKNRFSYIVNIDQSPKIRYTAATGAQVNVITQDSKHWVAEVFAGDRVNTYEIWYYYQNDQVPNTEFTDWTTCLTYTSAVKPTGWNTIADVLDKHSGFGTFTPDGMVGKSGNDAVCLKTPYSTPGGGNIPGFITLGLVSGQWGIAGTSSFNISGGLSFHNTPDQMSIRYYNSKVTDNNLIQYSLTGMNGMKTLEWKDSETSSDYKEVVYDLGEANNTVGAPSLLNITLCSYNTTDGTTGSLSTAAEMYVDYIRFSYNSKLKGITVNGIKATKNNNTFKVILADSEDTTLPDIVFEGEVSDQAQKINKWQTSKSTSYSIRSTTFMNYAENGDSTKYLLEIHRPLSTRNTLGALLLNGDTIANFSPDTIEYICHLPSYIKHLPDVQPIAGSGLQTITTSYADSTFTINVKPEKGDVKTYTIRFVTDLSDNTQLSSITAEGATIEFDPAQTNYTITANSMPAITFVKMMDGQTAHLNNGVITVTAGNGSVGTYTIRIEKPIVTTTGKLAELEINNMAWQEFNPNTYDYTREQPTNVAFKRMAESDSVIFVQTPHYMEWQVIGSEQHAYRITYPVALSDDATLKAFYINSEPYNEFDKQVYDYTYHTDEDVHIHAIANSKAKHLAVSKSITNDATTYTYVVTAEDGTEGAPYTLTVVPNLSSTPTLNGILIDGTLIPDFRPDSLKYTVTLPVGEYKQSEPTIPSLSYELGAPRQQATIEYGKLGEPTYITVLSEDGLAQVLYEVLIQAEPSHNALLTGIAVNGEPIQRFNSKRFYYSATTLTEEITFTWASDDRFQTVTHLMEDGAHILRVTAQDGVTTNDYSIEVHHQLPSDNATLEQIYLDGVDFAHFLTDINPTLDFSPMQQRYVINLLSGTKTLPEVSAKLQEEGQTVDIKNDGWTTLITVTAPNGITKNTYTLQFFAPMSSNAHLKMIYLDGDTLNNFAPDRYNYFIDLPVGQTTLPDIYAEPQERMQTVVDSLTGEWQHTIYVTAEDGTKQQYLLAFNFVPSQADTLMAIYGDGLLIDGFRPDSFYYAYTLPVGSNHIPELTWDEADQWQTITPSIAHESEYQRITQLQVVAMSGRKNTYTVSYTIQQSNCDTLQMIYVQSDSLLGFQPYTNDYYINLAPGDSVAPTIAWQEGDAYQTVNHTTVPYDIAGTTIGWKQILEVTAQNGQTRTYTLHFLFSKILSTNTQLSNIYLNGQTLDGFAPEQYTYLIPLMEEENTPSILVEKGEPMQTVHIEQGDTAIITVIAEDTTVTATYTIIFQRQMSPYSYLSAIYQDQVLIEGFRPDSFLYDITLPYGTTTLPEFTYDLGKEGQAVSIDTFLVTVNEREQTTLRLSVTAPDPMYSSEYDLRIMVALNDDCRLKTIFIRGTELADFHTDTTSYVITYPIGSDSTVFATIEDIQAIAQDENATVQISETDGNFTIQVDAADGQHSRVYTIQQDILRSSNAFLQAIYLDSTIIRDFDAEVFEYSYYIQETTPAITAIPQDSNAVVEYSMYVAGEPLYIYVTAHDGTELIYTINFLQSTVNAAQTPMANDVLVKHVPGTMDLIFATLRKNVSVAVYTPNGRMIYYSKLTESNQNDAIVVTNADGSDRLLDVLTTTNIYTLPEANCTYLYCFYENEKRRIASGKLVIAQ